MTSKTKAKLGILASNYGSLCYIGFAPIIADMAGAFPDTSLSLIQMIMTLPNFVMMIVSPISGKLSQHIRKKTLMLTAVALYFTGGIFPFFFHGNIFQILFGSALIGIGSGILSPMINAVICENFEGTERGSLMGMSATFVAVGGLSFTFVSGQLARLGWHYSFLLFLLLIPIFLIMLFCLPEGSVQRPAGGKAGRSGFEMTPYIGFLFGMGVVYFVMQNGFNTNSSLYIAEMGIGGADTASTVTMSNTLGGICGGMLFGFAVSRLDHQIETLATGLAAAGFFLAFLLPWLVPILGAAFLVGAGFAMFNAGGSYLLSKHLSPEANAFTMSVYISVINLGAALSPVVVNTLSSLFSGTSAIRYLVCGMTILVCTVTSFVVNKNKVK